MQYIKEFLQRSMDYLVIENINLINMWDCSDEFYVHLLSLIPRISIKLHN